MNAFQHLDDRWFLDVNTFARDTAWLQGPLLDYARYGVVLFAVLLGAGLLVARRRDNRTLAMAAWAGAATLLAVAVNQPIGHAVAEPRPYARLPHILVLGSRTTDFSFPSDHAVMAGAVAAGLLLVSRGLGLVAAAAAGVMAFARVYVGAHYPWDVLAGLLVGAGVTLLGWTALRTLLTGLVTWLRPRPGLAPLLGVGPDDAPRRAGQVR